MYINEKKIALEITNKYFDLLMRIDVFDLEHASELLDELNERDTRFESDILWEIEGEDMKFEYVVSNVFELLQTLQK